MIEVNATSLGQRVCVITAASGVPIPIKEVPRRYCPIEHLQLGVARELGIHPLDDTVDDEIFDLPDDRNVPVVVCCSTKIHLPLVRP